LPHHYRSHTHHLYWLHFERLEHPTLTSNFFSGFKRLLMEVVHAKRFVVMVKRDRAEGLGLQPDVGFGGGVGSLCG
jgi:hypothetical protein